MSEIDFIRQTFEDMQEQKICLMQNLYRTANANIMLMSAHQIYVDLLYKHLREEKSIQKCIKGGGGRYLQRRKREGKRRDVESYSSESHLYLVDTDTLGHIPGSHMMLLGVGKFLKTHAVRQIRCKA